MMRPPDYFEQIRTNATRRWEQLDADPELAGPWHQLFKQVQSPRHVLSELLQNADDAGATEACVSVRDGYFTFSHNGEDFIEDHFASLCRFGYSNKRALHTIGFRGIGFKSTFSLGDTVELSSPSLSVAFDKKRFTAPRWIESGHRQDGLTHVRVRIGSEHRERELEKNLKEWIASPLSLLFFRNVRSMRIGDQEASWESLGPGPVADSEWMRLKGESQERFLIIRSQPEDFPDDAMAEIRQERLLGADQAMDFPPCKVEIVLGAKGRLYVVLPTGVETELPFACNAPFIQDPARMKIKDPETSPTNYWLLQRIGRLAAEAALAWISDTNLSLDDRAKAYALLPDVERYGDTLESDCGTIAEEAFGEAVSERDFLLTHDGQLVIEERCLAVPRAFFEIWPVDQIVEAFGDGSQQPMSEAVSDTDRAKLVTWGLIQEIGLAEAIKTLKDNQLPKPKTWAQLLKLWGFVAPEVLKRRWGQNHSDLNILPVQGKEVLYAAEDVVRLGEKRLLQSDADWAFLSRYLLVLNQNWSRFLAEQRRLAIEQGTSDADVENAHNMLRELSLDQSSDADDVLEQVASAFFSEENPPLTQCIQLAQIAAKLGATVGSSFEYVTRDQCLTSVLSGLVIDLDRQLETLFDSNWVEAYFLHDDYGSKFSSCTAEEWQHWIASGKSGLLGFPNLVAAKVNIWQRSAVKAQLLSRGLTTPLQFPYVTSQFHLQDWDFEEEHWAYWKLLAADDPSIWTEIVDRILAQPEAWSVKARVAKAYQTATSGGTRQITWDPLWPSWILKLRDLACLRDTRGTPRKPSELLRRTPETEALMDVELFVHGKLDNESSRWLLDLLGVRDQPTGPDRLLGCLRGLAKSKTPPIHEVEKWYRRLDQMIENCDTSNFAMISKAFRDEKIILTRDGDWSNSAGVFLGADEEDAPGAALVCASVQDLMLWPKVGVATRPTADKAIEWLSTLQVGQTLAQEESKRVRALISRHPARIWAECQCWLNLAGEWVSVETLKYALSMQSLVAWNHLHKYVKQSIADFRNVAYDLLADPPFSLLPSVASQINERFGQKVSVTQHPVHKPWLSQLGIELQRYRSDDEIERARIHSLALELSQTLWQASHQLETTPYINGKPVGTARRVDVVWNDRVLYVEQGPLAKLAQPVAQELGKNFQKPEIIDAIKFCIDRSPDFVTAYMEENFRLDPKLSDPESEAEPSETNSASQGKKSETTGDPKHEQPPETDPDLDFDDPEDEGGEQTSGEQPESPDSQGTGTSTENDPAPKHAPKPQKTGVIERFAVSRGYRKDGDARYAHPDGRSIAKSHGGRFPWELRDVSGHTQLHYLPREHCLENEPLQLDADVWAMLEQMPGSYALILESPDGKPVEVSGASLSKMLAESRITLFPASYRLVFDNNNQ